MLLKRGTAGARQTTQTFEGLRADKLKHLSIWGRPHKYSTVVKAVYFSSPNEWEMGQGKIVVLWPKEVVIITEVKILLLMHLTSASKGWLWYRARVW
jgi:hypothetical protein